MDKVHFFYMDVAMEINTNDTIVERKNQQNRKKGEKTSFLNELM